MAFLSCFDLLFFFFPLTIDFLVKLYRPGYPGNSSRSTPTSPDAPLTIVHTVYDSLFETISAITSHPHFFYHIVMFRALLSWILVIVHRSVLGYLFVGMSKKHPRITAIYYGSPLSVNSLSPVSCHTTSNQEKHNQTRFDTSYNLGSGGSRQCDPHCWQFRPGCHGTRVLSLPNFPPGSPRPPQRAP